METEQCPSCHATTIITGILVGREPASVFVPDHSKLQRVWYGVSALHGGSLKCCCSCGHVWTGVDPGRLRSFLEAYGDELTKQDAGLVLPESGLAPMGSPEGTEALRRVREIDWLIRIMRTGEATRRHRELTGGTWDRSVDIIRHWGDLTRDQKLAQFGWQTKRAVKSGEAKEAVHPLHDRELDD